jgi:hypothetical protein
MYCMENVSYCIAELFWTSMKRFPDTIFDHGFSWSTKPCPAPNISFLHRTYAWKSKYITPVVCGLYVHDLCDLKARIMRPRCTRVAAVSRYQSTHTIHTIHAYIAGNINRSGNVIGMVHAAAAELFGISFTFDGRKYVHT